MPSFHTEATKVSGEVASALSLNVTCMRLWKGNDKMSNLTLSFYLFFPQPFLPYLERACGGLAGVQAHGHIGPQQSVPCLHGRRLEACGLEARVHRGALVRDIARAGDVHKKGVGGAVESMLVRAGLHEQLRQAEGDDERIILAGSHAATAEMEMEMEMEMAEMEMGSVGAEDGAFEGESVATTRGGHGVTGLV